NRVERGVTIAQQLARGAEQRVARDREPHRATRPFEERRLQLALEPLDALRQRGLRDSERGGGAGETAMVDDGGGVLDCTQFHEPARCLRLIDRKIRCYRQVVWA